MELIIFALCVGVVLFIKSQNKKAQINKLKSLLETVGDSTKKKNDQLKILKDEWERNCKSQENITDSKQNEKIASLLKSKTDEVLKLKAENYELLSDLNFYKKKLNDVSIEFKKKEEKQASFEKTLEVKLVKQNQNIQFLLSEKSHLLGKLHEIKEQATKKQAELESYIAMLEQRANRPQIQKVIPTDIPRVIPIQVEVDNDDLEDDGLDCISLDALKQEADEFEDISEDWSDSYDDLDGAYWSDYMGGDCPDDRPYH